MQALHNLIMILWYINSGFMFAYLSVYVNGFILYNVSSKIEIKISGLFLEKKKNDKLLIQLNIGPHLLRLFTTLHFYF